MNRTLILLFLLLSALVLAGCGSSKYRHMYVQGMIGANAVGRDEVTYRETNESDPDTDLNTAPSLAFAGQQPLTGDKDANAGIEFGASFTWWANGVDIYGYAGGGGSVVILDWDNRMWMNDIFVGPYGSLMISDRLRLYGGGGGALTWAGLEYDTTYETANGQIYQIKGYEDDWSWGWYGRAGLEYRTGRHDFLGISVRYLSTDFTFREIDTKLDLDTWQVMLTATTKF